MLTDIHTKARILLKDFNVFRSENLALYTVTAFIASEKVQNQKLKNKKKGTENSRLI